MELIQLNAVAEGFILASLNNEGYLHSTNIFIFQKGLEDPAFIVVAFIYVWLSKLSII